MSYYIKIITGFRKDQEHTVPADEAHKAYYLFLNPSARGIFSNGVALTGSQIQSIVPDYHATMGWHPSHQLDSYDHDEIQKKGVDQKIQGMLAMGKQVAMTPNAQARLSLPLSTLLDAESPRASLPKNR